MTDTPLGSDGTSSVLVRHALSIEWGSLDQATRDTAVAFIRDTLAVGAAGARAAHADDVLSISRAWGEGEGAGVLGRPDLRLPPNAAAFVNAFQIHGQEFDCVHEAAVLHPLSTLVAALLAELARGEPIGGTELLSAIVAGVDIAVALGLAAPGPFNFFRPAVAGIFGSTAGIARARRLPAAVARDALGHGLAFASGTMQAHVEGKPGLPLQVANAARNSLLAIDLARAGVPGVEQPIEGPFGYAALFEPGSAFDLDRARLGQGYRIADLSWKPFATGRAAHGGIVAVQQMAREQGVGANMLLTLEYRAPPLIKRLVGRPATAAMTPGYARLCLPYLAAVTLLRGEVTVDDFTPERLGDPRVLAMAGRISVSDNGNPDPAAFVPAEAIARLTDGRIVMIPVSALLGSPQWPLDETMQRAKMEQCLGFVGLADKQDALWEAIDALADAPDALATIRRSGIIG